MLGVVVLSKSNLNLCSSVPTTTLISIPPTSSPVFSHLKNLTVLFCAGANEKSS